MDALDPFSNLSFQTCFLFYTFFLFPFCPFVSFHLCLVCFSGRARGRPGALADKSCQPLAAWRHFGHFLRFLDLPTGFVIEVST